jgi:hypothetical protein
MTIMKLAASAAITAAITCSAAMAEPLQLLCINDKDLNDPAYKVSIDQSNKTVNFDGGEYVLTQFDSKFIGFAQYVPNAPKKIGDIGWIDRITGELHIYALWRLRLLRLQCSALKIGEHG